MQFKGSTILSGIFGSIFVGSTIFASPGPVIGNGAFVSAQKLFLLKGDDWNETKENGKNQTYL